MWPSGIEVAHNVSSDSEMCHQQRYSILPNSRPCRTTVLTQSAAAKPAEAGSRGNSRLWLCVCSPADVLALWLVVRLEALAVILSVS